MGRLIENLAQEELFVSDLKPDVEAGKVFFAGRPNCGAFYIKGRSLFTYKSGGFSTHQKFGFIPDGLNGNYIFEKQLQSVLPVKNFHLGYEDIKKRAAQYADIEAEGVAALYKYAPTAESCGKRYFLVDIEVVFDSENDAPINGDERKTDRIDILLYDNQERQLLFCEAKHFSNPEIWGESPAVLSQLQRYKNQIAANEKNIIKQYTKAFEEYNLLMGSSLNTPASVNGSCGLYIFGFNRVEQAKIKARLDADGNFFGHKCRIIGDTQNDSAEKIYGALK